MMIMQICLRTQEFSGDQSPETRESLVQVVSSAGRDQPPAQSALFSRQQFYRLHDPVAGPSGHVPRRTQEVRHGSGTRGSRIRAVAQADLPLCATVPPVAATAPAARDVMSPFWCSTVRLAREWHHNGPMNPDGCIPFLPGEPITPLLSTSFPRQLSFGETVLPFAPPCDFDAARVSMGLGMATIDTVIDSGDSVGPLQCCITQLSGGVRLWGAASDSVYDAGSILQGGTHEFRSQYHYRFRASRPEPSAYSTAEPGAFHDGLSLTGARKRDVASQLVGLRARAVRHV